ncbi:septum site-determining protein Ssd [Granulicoccus sp. GXG6511]|uniref:septum site-determining protein Ssd n=1 Tax=Granulicoccus sp. GXG6511 TaxID=3381351 RepID=UPI003D7D414D
MVNTGVGPAVLVTGVTEIRERVLAAAAAAAVEVRIAGDATELGAGPEPRTLFVGPDQVALVARSPLLGRAPVQLVGLSADRDRLCEWSAALGAAVIVLPDGVRWLAHALSGDHGGAAATVVGLLGAAGGVGASTLAAGLAQSAAHRGNRVALVDLDDRGGGLDLLMGLADAPGWRWPNLLDADGFLGDLHAHLPRLDGLAVLSHDRADPAPPSATAIVAVLRSLARSHDLVLLDLGSRPAAAELGALRAADGVVVVCPGDVRGVAAGVQQLRQVDSHVPIAAVLSRLRPGGLGREQVARALGVPVLATMPHDRAVAAEAERGDPPGRTAGRAWRRCCGVLLDGVLEARDDRG